MSKTQLFAIIMAFYAILSFFLFPYLFYVFGSRHSFDSAANGMIVGCIVSITLWYSFGRKAVM